MNKRTKLASTLNLGLPLMGATALAITAMTWSTPVAGFVGVSTADPGPSAIPAWTHADARQFPGCESLRQDGTIAGRVVVVKENGHVVSMSLDAAVARHDAGVSQWVVGGCY